MQSSQQGISALVDSLNRAIWSEHQGRIFYGGQGVVVRNLNDALVNKENCKVVPGSFWHNDIWPPNQIYPAANIWDGDENYNWLAPTLAVAIGPEHFGHLFTGNIQDVSVTDGVWYAHDSNCCDKRALWYESEKHYDAPYAWIDCNQAPPIVKPYPDKYGSGNYEAGNPFAGYEGGGTGVHTKYNYDEGATQTNYIEQIDGKTVIPNRDLLSDYTCQIKYEDWNNVSPEKYDAVDGWMDWIQHFANDANACLDENGNQRYHGQAWTANLAMGWLDHPRKMITLQNALWKYSNIWCTGIVPPHPTHPKHYWGWNEIPFSKEQINKPDNWSCFIIVLPPEIKYLCNALENETAKQNLIAQLDFYAKEFEFHPNSSSIVLVRQIPNENAKDYPAGLVWMREFFAEDVTIGNGWRIANGVICKDS